jgi:CheY-like chemotaxis protein
VAKVLVVEDDPFIIMWVEDALCEAGHNVLTARNADTAVEILERDTSIQLVFTDIDMPGSMDGLKLASAVRDRWPPVHIIIASGKHRPKRDEMPLNAVFLPKPYLPKDILGAVGGFN